MTTFEAGWKREAWIEAVRVAVLLYADRSGRGEDWAASVMVDAIRRSEGTWLVEPSSIASEAVKFVREQAGER